MRILILNYEYPPLGGGAGIITKELANQLSKKNEILLITSGKSGLPFIQKENNLKVIRIPVFRKRNEKSRILEMFFYVINALLIFPFIGNFKPDVIHSHFILPTGIVGLLYSFFLRIPHIITAHGGDIPSHQPEQTKKLFKIFKPLASVILKNCKKIVIVSESLKEKALLDFSFIENKTEIIHNGILLNEKKKNIRKFEKFTFLFAGRFSKEKNLITLIKILPKLKTDFQLLLIGDGKERLFLESEVERLKLKEKVIFKGWLERENIFSLMRKSHIFVLPSSSEGMPISILEAYSNKLPVLGNNIKSIKRLIENKNYGYLCDFNRPAELVKILNLIINNRYILEKMGLKSYEFVKENFTIEEISKKYLKIFESLKKNES